MLFTSTVKPYTLSVLKRMMEIPELKDFSIPNALVYFEDAEESDDPVSLQGQTWVDIKKFIQSKVREFLS